MVDIRSVVSRAIRELTTGTECVDLLFFVSKLPESELAVLKEDDPAQLLVQFVRLSRATGMLLAFPASYPVLCCHMLPSGRCAAYDCTWLMRSIASHWAPGPGPRYPGTDVALAQTTVYSAT